MMIFRTARFRSRRVKLRDPPRRILSGTLRLERLSRLHRRRIRSQRRTGLRGLRHQRVRLLRAEQRGGGGGSEGDERRRVEEHRGAAVRRGQHRHDLLRHDLQRHLRDGPGEVPGRAGRHGEREGLVARLAALAARALGDDGRDAEAHGELGREAAVGVALKVGAGGDLVGEGEDDAADEVWGRGGRELLAGGEGLDDAALLHWLVADAAAHPVDQSAMFVHLIRDIIRIRRGWMR